MAEPLHLSLTEPDYGGKCITQILPALITGVPNHVVAQPVCEASAVVLLVVDGLGWHQLQRRAKTAPLLAGLATGGSAAAQSGEPPAAITTVAPSTTCAALTAITTGATPAEHGLVGLTFLTAAGLLGTLGWTVKQPDGTKKYPQDARQLLPPETLQSVEPFAGTRACVVTRSKFASTGFTTAHLRGAKFAGYKSHRQIVPTVAEQIAAGEKLVYAYYDSLDRAAHLYGLGNRYQAILSGVDAMVDALLDRLPSDVAVLVTADHGVLEVTQPPVPLNQNVLAHTLYSSGEPRFRWLHAQPGRAEDLFAATAEQYLGTCEVMTRQQLLAAQWLGPHMTPAIEERLGDVAVIAKEAVIIGEAVGGEGSAQATLANRGRWTKFIGHHGALTAEEMLVPLAQFWGRDRQG